MKTLMAGCAVILFFAACRSGQGVSSGGSVKEDTGDYRVAERMDTMPFHMVAPFRSEFELQTGSDRCDYTGCSLQILGVCPQKG